MATAKSDAQFGEALWNNIVDLFLKPEIDRRLKAGTLVNPVVIAAVQILLPSDRAQIIRLNDEIKGILTVEPIKKGHLVKGKAISMSDFKSMHGFAPIKEEIDSGYIAAFVLNNEIKIYFNFTYNIKIAEERLEQANEFIVAAEFSFKNSFWGPTIDLLTTAMELLFKSRMCLHADTQSESIRTHVANQLYIAQVAENSNIVSKDFSESFNYLAGIRSAARYQRNYPVKMEKIEKAFEVVRVLSTQVFHIINSKKG